MIVINLIISTYDWATVIKLVSGYTRCKVDLKPHSFSRFYVIFKGHSFQGTRLSGCVFEMRATIPRWPKETIVEIFKKSAKNVCVAFKQLLVQSSNTNSKARYEIFSKLTIKTPDRTTLRKDFNSWFCVFIVDFE